MRVPDHILKSVVFIGQDTFEDGREFFKPGGTGFLVGMRTKDKDLAGRFYYLVTARHSALELAGRPFGVRVNMKDGTFKVAMSGAGFRWWFHPTEEESVDVAVAPWGVEDGEDTVFIPDEMFLDKGRIEKFCIGVGDEVFVTGLFTKLHGREQNMPIVRTGTVAMMPGEVLPQAKIGDWVGEIEAYLVESRSISGLSGSPVFVRETLQQEAMVMWPSGGMGPTTAYLQGAFHLLGLMQGHWEIEPRDKNKYVFRAGKSDDSVNLGIAVVVPSKKILEVLNHPELVETRRLLEEAEIQKGGTTTPD